jgi:hypothetical protein
MAPKLTGLPHDAADIILGSGGGDGVPPAIAGHPGCRTAATEIIVMGRNPVPDALLMHKLYYALRNFLR